MERSHIQSLGVVLSDELPNALLHLVGGLVGERQREDVPRLHSLRQQIGDFVGQHAGFARACACNHELRPVAVFHRLSLAVV